MRREAGGSTEGCSLTTPHKLRGRGWIGKPTPAGMVVFGRYKTMAARWQHAVVRSPRSGFARLSRSTPE